MHDVLYKKCSPSRSFCHLHLSMFGLDIDVASVKHYLNAKKAKQSALNARKPLVGGREPHLCFRPFGLELRPFKPRACRDPPLAE